MVVEGAREEGGMAVVGGEHFFVFFFVSAACLLVGIAFCLPIMGPAPARGRWSGRRLLETGVGVEREGDPRPAGVARRVMLDALRYYYE